ncbi:hypothetical protein CRYUN_Cryun21dG0003000 [Craigia yunnanensis]
MQSFKAAAPTIPYMFCHSSFFLRGDDCNRRHQTRFSDLGELDHPAAAFHHDDAVDLSPSSFFSLKSSNVAVVANSSHYGALNTLGDGHIENWGDSGLEDNSQQTDTSTDVDTDDKNQLHGVQHGAIITVDSVGKSKLKTGDQKTLRRLAQNREAARKSRLRKKGIFIASGLSGDHVHSVTGNGEETLDTVLVVSS